MKTVKQAADVLISKGKISNEEYKALEQIKCFEKEASAKDIANAIRNIVFPIAAIGATGVVGKELVYDPIKKSKEINKSFKMITKKVPQLEEKNKKDIEDYFNVVKTFSPKAASNPLVAGALVNKMIEFGGVDHKLVQDISAIEQGLSRPSTIQTITESTAKSVVGIPEK